MPRENSVGPAGRGSDKEFGKYLVAGDVTILEPGPVELAQERAEILGLCRLDPDEDRPEVARGFLEIFEAGDVVLRPEIKRVFEENWRVYGVRKVWRRGSAVGDPARPIS